MEEEDETAMMLEGETVGRMREGQKHSDYNYQLDSMMTCPCEKPSFPYSALPPSLFLSLSFSLPIYFQLVYVKPNTEQGIINYHVRLLLQRL